MWIKQLSLTAINKVIRVILFTRSFICFNLVFMFWYCGLLVYVFITDLELTNSGGLMSGLTGYARFSTSPEWGLAFPLGAFLDPNVLSWNWNVIKVKNISDYFLTNFPVPKKIYCFKWSRINQHFQLNLYKLFSTIWFFFSFCMFEVFMYSTYL